MFACDFFCVWCVGVGVCGVYVVCFCVCSVCVLFMVSVWYVCVMCSMHVVWYSMCDIVDNYTCDAGVSVCVVCDVCMWYIHVRGVCIVCDVYAVYMWCAVCVVCVSTCSSRGCPTQTHNNKQHLSQVEIARRLPGICTWFWIPQPAANTSCSLGSLGEKDATIIGSV